MKVNLSHNNPYRQFVGSLDGRQDSGIITPRDFRCPTISKLPQERHLLSARREIPDRLRSAFRNGWGRIKAFSHVLDDSWVGDLIALIALAVMIYIGFILVGVFA